MKQLLFLLLFPCLALAQYQGNAGQKITLGEQTSADGLVWRGRLADTANLLTNKLDTSVYIVLDTGTRAMWYYRASTTPKWTRLVDSLNNLQGQLSLTTKVTGVLPVANGGTGQTTLAAANINTGSGTLNYLPKYTANGTTLGNSSIYDNGSNVGIGFNVPSEKLFVNSGAANMDTIISYGTNTKGIVLNQDNGGGYGMGIWFRQAGLTAGIGSTRVNSSSWATDLRFYTHPSAFENQNTLYERMRINSEGNFGIGTLSPAVQFHTTEGVRFAGLASITDLRTDADGDLFNGSDFNLKNTIDTINFGLSDVLKLKPVSFNWNDEARNINEYKSMGFIAQDIMDVIPNAASTMGDGDMQVDYNAIVATLTKAIQEQQALIKALEQRILILENK